MRSSLSCDVCRRAKVKCVHSGSPPCRRCSKNKITGCTLIRPQVPSSIQRPRNSPAGSVAKGPSQRRAHLSPSQPRYASQEQEETQPPPQKRTSSQGDGVEDVGQHILSLPRSVILKSLHLFSNKFPELSILHTPTILADLEPASSRPEDCNALIGAVLAVTRAQASLVGAPWASQLLEREQYALYSRSLLSDLILSPPKIQVVQALLIITLHEWGSRDFHKAWVYCGIAIRVMQALHSMRVAPCALDPSSERESRNPTAVATETRTYWGCFIMDCMVNSGTYNPPMLPMPEMIKLKIPRPLNAVDFTFGPDATDMSLSERPPFVPEPSTPAVQSFSNGTLHVAQSFEVLVGGFDIWAKVMEFLFNDGRKAPGMCAPHNCPWVPGSPWSITWGRLLAWRAGQHRNLHYPATSVAMHMALGYGETFTYVNLLYYVSVLLLHREYAPFLPTPESTPVGPIDPPRLEATAPENWWEDSVAQIVQSAESIAKLLHEASECGTQLMTPFIGFCAFSAAFILIYVHHFPRMNLDRSPDAEKYEKICLSYLEEFRSVWKIADGWIKTLHHVSLLYARASTTSTYRGRTRADFEHFHQSVNEFRVVDRSKQQNQEMDQAATGPEQMVPESVGICTDDLSPDTNFLLSQLLAEVSSNMEEQGPWSQWWPLGEIELPSAAADSGFDLGGYGAEN
ncbi:unnamed protein product [Clonostachys chloroleuca]|uniref:Zn(2)-C6 fungal-type domain-containing protein n=1 Tax=Clonostachys chloroleuca TaxID=1926264 RepID=A0AA35Q954_9HYPO|nr:unnamed protein product [Clonostachys chloroleuca]